MIVHMSAFTSCAMPDLADLEKSPAYLEAVLRLTFHNTGPRDAGALGLTNGLYASLDKAVIDYQASRREVERYLDDTRRPISAVIRASLHIQGCLVSAARVLRFAEMLRRHENAPGAVDKVQLRIAVAHLDDLRDLRNAIEHMYEGMDDKVGKPTLPRLNADASEFQLLVVEDGVERIVTTRTAQLADLMLTLDALARCVAAWAPVTRQGSSAT
jgi:hypothetical protein